MMHEGKSCWLKNIKTIVEKICMNELLPKPDECHLPSIKRKVKQKLRNILLNLLNLRVTCMVMHGTMGKVTS